MDIVQTSYKGKIDSQEALDSACPTLLPLLAKLSDKPAYTVSAAMIGIMITVPFVMV